MEVDEPAGEVPRRRKTDVAPAVAQAAYNDVTIQIVDAAEQAYHHDQYLRHIIFRRQIARIFRWLRSAMAIILGAVLASIATTGIVPPWIIGIGKAVVSRIHSWTAP